MRYSLLLAALAFAAPAWAERVVCTPVMSCFTPEGECEAPGENETPGVIVLTENQISLSEQNSPNSLSFSIVSTSTNAQSTSYFTKFEGGHALFSFFNNGDLAMQATRSNNGISAATAYFYCEDAPWKTS